MDLKALYRNRSVQFLKEIRPYLHYALQGGAVTAGLAFLLISIGYRQFLQWVTPDFPWELLSAAVMLPVLAGGGIRTYLQEADTLFLLPQEQQMDAYLRAAEKRAMIRQSIAVTALWLLVWPLYYKLAGGSGWFFALLLVVWLVYKRVILFGKWAELQMAEKRARQGFASLRWVLTAVITYSMFQWKPVYGIAALAVCSIGYLLLLRLPRKYIVHWALLIEAERSQKARIYRMLNWFVDVPAVQGKARNNRFLDGAVRKIPFRQDRAYSYLYTLVWLRSELFGIVLRLTAIGVLLLAFVPNDIAQAVIYAAFGAFGALQLADLKRYYREHVWQHIYPLTAEQRLRGVRSVRLRIHFGMLVLLAVPVFVTLAAPLWAAALLICAAAVSWVYHRYK